MNIKERIISWLGITAQQSLITILKDEIQELLSRMNRLEGVQRTQHSDMPNRLQVNSLERNIASTRREVEELGILARKTLLGIGGGVWTTAEGHTRGIAFLSDDHLATLSNGWAQGEVLEAVQAEQARRADDDKWAERHGKMSLRNRVAALEAAEEWEDQPTIEDIAIIKRTMVGYPGGLGVYGPATTEDLAKMSPTGRTLDRECSFEFGSQMQSPGYTSRKTPNSFSRAILTTAEAKEFPDHPYLTPGEAGSNGQGHGHAPRSYNERKASSAAGEAKLAAKVVPMFLNVDFAEMESRALVVGFIREALRAKGLI